MQPQILQGHVLLATTPKLYIMQDSEHMFKGLSSQVSVCMYGVGGVVGGNN